MRPRGIETITVDMRTPEAVAAALTDRTRQAWLATPTNPLQHLADIAAISALARARGVPVVGDNTFASPMLKNPLDLGATAVVHSTTKYINGHSDVVGGAIITSDAALAGRLKFLQNAIGAVPSPMDCYLVLRGVKTLAVRMQRHVETASELAARLEKAPGVKRVAYPGLASHPQRELGRRQMRGPGGMVTLELEGGEAIARALLKHLRIFSLAESLGGVDALAEHPSIISLASIPSEVRRGLGTSVS